VRRKVTEVRGKRRATFSHVTYKAKLNVALSPLNLTLHHIPWLRPLDATYKIPFNKIFCAPYSFELKFATFIGL